MSLRYLTVKQLAEVTNFHVRTVQKRLRYVQPYETSGGRTLYDANAVLPLLFQVDDQDKARLMAEKLKYQKARTDMMLIKVTKLEEDLVCPIEAAQDVRNEFAAVRKFLGAIPGNAAEQVAKATDPAVVKAILDDTINQALIDVCDYAEAKVAAIDAKHK